MFHNEGFTMSYINIKGKKRKERKRKKEKKNREKRTYFRVLV